ncbi:MAG: 3-methyladenine DNA glycosylase, partial [Actinomycetota bacterium]|nr:3-methyladenine DNA glycosylase [Actinomycetota bacterium]
MLQDVAARPAVLAAAQWLPLAEAHAHRADELTRGHRERAGLRQPHPVEDFLFTYYSLRPARLRRWHAGVEQALLGAAARDRLAWRWYAEVEAVDADGRAVAAVGLDLAAYLADRGDVVAFVADLLGAIDRRPAQLGCFGLHEWAMVYRSPKHEVRHEDWPLRLGPGGTDAVVEAHQLRCSHFDAYRFFAPEALDRNAIRPTRETQVQLDQPGCLHATMDLYRYSYKLGPLVPGELLLACFELARDIRVLDMRASPYDLTALGYSPVKIETPAGKSEYVAAQRAFSIRAQPLRQQLIETCKQVLPPSSRP